MGPVHGSLPDTPGTHGSGPVREAHPVDHGGDAREHGCRFHRAWYARDGSAFYAVAKWETREGANAFFEEWNIEDEPGEVAIMLEGDVGLVPLP